MPTASVADASGQIVTIGSEIDSTPVIQEVKNLIESLDVSSVNYQAEAIGRGHVWGTQTLTTKEHIISLERLQNNADGADLRLTLSDSSASVIYNFSGSIRRENENIVQSVMTKKINELFDSAIQFGKSITEAEVKANLDADIQAGKLEFLDIDSWIDADTPISLLQDEATDRNIRIIAAIENTYEERGTIRLEKFEFADEQFAIGYRGIITTETPFSTAHVLIEETGFKELVEQVLRENESCQLKSAAMENALPELIKNINNPDWETDSEGAMIVINNLRYRACFEAEGVDLGAPSYIAVHSINRDFAPFLLEGSKALEFCKELAQRAHEGEISI